MLRNGLLLRSGLLLRNGLVLRKEQLPQCRRPQPDLLLAPGMEHQLLRYASMGPFWRPQA